VSRTWTIADPADMVDMSLGEPEIQKVSSRYGFPKTENPFSATAADSTVSGILPVRENTLKIAPDRTLAVHRLQRR
jgi:hypothetical protein